MLDLGPCYQERRDKAFLQKVKTSYVDMHRIHDIFKWADDLIVILSVIDLYVSDNKLRMQHETLYSI